MLNVRPDNYSSWTYDAIGDALCRDRQAGSTDPDKIRAAILSIRATEVRGRLQFRRVRDSWPMQDRAQQERGHRSSTSTSNSPIERRRTYAVTLYLGGGEHCDEMTFGDRTLHVDSTSPIASSAQILLKNSNFCLDHNSEDRWQSPWKFP